MADQAEIFYFNTNEHYRAKVETQTREDRFIKWAKAKFPNHPTAKSNFILQKLRSIKDTEEISQINEIDIAKRLQKGLFINPGVWSLKLKQNLPANFLKTDPMDLPTAPSLLLEIIVMSYTT